MSINVNTATTEELKQIPGVGEKVAQLLIQFRDVYGVIKKEAMNLALRRHLSDEVLEMIDFSVPKLDDPFDIDLSCLPSVPKNDSWEPLVSFAHQTASGRSRSPQEPESEVWHPLTLPSAYNPRKASMSPVRESASKLASQLSDQEASAVLAAASSIHEPEESRSCRTDSRSESHGDKEDKKPAERKTPEPSTSRGSERGIGSCRSRSPRAHRSSSRSPSSQRRSRKHSPKHTRTHRRHSKRSRSHSGSGSRSRANQRRSRKHSPKHIRTHRRHSKRSRSHSGSLSVSRSNSGSVSRSRSQSKRSKSKSRISKKRPSRSRSRSTSGSRSTSRSRSNQSHSKTDSSNVKKKDKSSSKKTDSEAMKKKDRSRSRSSSRSKSAHHHSRKSDSKVVKKKERSHSGSSLRSRSAHSKMSDANLLKKKKHISSRSTSGSRSVEPKSRKSGTKHVKKKKRDSSRSTSRSKSVRRSSRKHDSKKNKSQKKIHKHSRSSSRSTSRSSSRSASRSSSSHSKSHKRRVKLKTKHDRSRMVYKHKRRSSSSSRSTSRSSSRSHSRSSHKRRAQTRPAKSKIHKHKRHTSSSSESQSRSPSRSRSRKSKGRSRSQKTKRRSRKHHHSSYSDSDRDSSVDRYSSKHGDPRKHPKALRFDGKSNWLSFKKKFDSYRKVMKWSEAESKDYLMWSLEGKALDFFTITTSDMEKYSLRKIMKKLEARFGVKELTETSKARFRQAFQKQDESLEDWADRVMTLATPAFVDLPEEHLKEEAIARFCQGCIDRDAAKHACFEHPKTMEEALNLVKHHQYISQAVDGKKAKREIEASVNAMQSPSEARIEHLIASALKDFAEKLQTSSQSSCQSSSDTEQNSDSKKKSSIQCFFCKKFGHMKKDCRVYQAWLRKKQENKSEDSEDQGRDRNPKQ